MSNISINNQLFKKSLVLFWGLWWLFALWTDVVGGLAHLGLLHAVWAPDTNYPFLVQSLKMYPMPVWLPPIFFIAIICGSAISAFSFCWVFPTLFKNNDVWFKRAKIAFIISLQFWLIFFLADQIVMKFDLAENHMVQGGFELLSFFALYILPE